MTHDGIYATSAECIGKLGDNYPATEIIEARINELCLQAESLINVVGRKVFAKDTTAFAALSSTVRGILTLITSNYVGIYGLTFKPQGNDGNLSRIEYEDRVNVLRDGMLQGLSILRDKKMQDFIDGA